MICGRSPVMNEVEPYRRVLKDLRDELIILRQELEARLRGDSVERQVAYGKLLTYLIQCS